MESRLGVDSVIIGAKQMDQPEENLESLSRNIPEEALNTLNTITDPPAYSPEWMYSMQNKGKLPDKTG